MKNLKKLLQTAIRDVKFEEEALKNQAIWFNLIVMKNWRF